jgi:hypothetical protein
MDINILPKTSVYGGHPIMRVADLPGYKWFQRKLKIDVWNLL